MFSIGEFSKMTGLTVKTLRFYHEQGLLVPSYVEPGSGYRFYCEAKIETARVIAALRTLEFPLAEIAEILKSHDDDSSLLDHLQSRRQGVQTRISKDRQLVRQLDEIIVNELEAIEKMSKSEHTVEEKTIDPVLVASVRMKGKYQDCGPGFGKIGRAFGRFICGKPMMLFHDGEYRADDANFEVAMPIKKGQPTDEIDVHELPGGRCLSLVHLGPYEELKRSYEKIMKYADTQGVKYQIPTREVYHKGPGMIFRGNPKKYVTEIQLLIENA
ncbi:MAG: MerR family transcriptional regulator [Planctomycetota bacterium]